MFISEIIDVMTATCIDADCDEAVHARSLCEPHYRKALRRGDIVGGDGPRRCDVPDCGRGHYAWGVCVTHYTRWKRGGPIEALIARRKTKKRGCARPKCTRKHNSHGYCRVHYRRDQSESDLAKPIQPTCRTVAERLACYTGEPDERGCRLWTGSANGGYGVMYVSEEKKTRLAHRVAYEVATGKKLGRREPVHHICATKLCVAPEHLQLVSQAENNVEMLERNWYKRRIAELEPLEELVDQLRTALATVIPDHPLLSA